MAAGNAVVWVPAPTTSACCALLAEIITGAGVPAGVFSFLPGPGPVVGDAVAGHPGVHAVGFIGSVATGASVAARAAGKTQLLELGGNGPMVVLEDADLGLAAEAALEAAYLCAGQSCTAGERFLVHAAVRDEFVERVVAATKDQIRLGDPFDPATTMGPLNNEPTAVKFDRHVAGALADGARVCCGGGRAAGFPTTLFAEPTVLDGVTPDMEIAREETFGPVVPVIEIGSAEQALELTNASPFGLTAAVFTEDLERGLAFAERARAGWVNINASTNLWESHLPFGGRSGSVSGRGRVGGRFAMETFTEPKTVVYPAPRYRTAARRAADRARRTAAPGVSRPRYTVGGGQPPVVCKASDGPPLKFRQPPVLVGSAVAGVDLDLGAVGRAGARVVQAQPRGLVDQAAVGPRRPDLGAAAVAGVQHGERALAVPPPAVSRHIRSSGTSRPAAMVHCCGLEPTQAWSTTLPPAAPPLVQARDVAVVLLLARVHRAGRPGARAAPGRRAAARPARCCRRRPRSAAGCCCWCWRPGRPGTGRSPG